MVATDYFTKWDEAISLKTVTSKNVVDFVKEHIVYHFGIPQTITTNFVKAADWADTWRCMSGAVHHACVGTR